MNASGLRFSFAVPDVKFSWDFYFLPFCFFYCGLHQLLENEDLMEHLLSCLSSCLSFPLAFQNLPSSRPRLMQILEHLTLLSPENLIPYAEALTASMSLLLEPAVPRCILQTLKKLWIGLNTVMPRRYMLWMNSLFISDKGSKILQWPPPVNIVLCTYPTA